MLIARAPNCLRLLSRPLSPFCCSYSTASPSAETRSSNNTKHQKRKKGIYTLKEPSQSIRLNQGYVSRRTIRERNEKTNKGSNVSGGMRRYVPIAAQKLFVFGELQTNPDVWEFFQETNIEWDTSKTRRLPLSRENSHIPKTFSCNISFSDNYIMSPYHLPVLLPWGHPLRDNIKSKYREKLKNEPLWVHFIMYGDVSPVVRSVARKRLAREFWAQLEELERQNPSQPRLKGTLFIELRNLQKAARAPAVQFGKALAEAVMKEGRVKDDNSKSPTWPLRERM